jgi:hypothetical protein
MGGLLFCLSELGQALYMKMFMLQIFAFARFFEFIHRFTFPHARPFVADDVYCKGQDALGEPPIPRSLPAR